MRLDLDFGGWGRVAFSANCGSKAMRSPKKGPMAEISESLRILGEADVRWAQLVSKFHTRLHVPAATDELNPNLPPFPEPPYAS
jgi:hypothetical protein